MKKRIRTPVSLPVGAADPTSNDGVAILETQRQEGGQIALTLAGGTSAGYELWGKTTAGTWGRLIDTGNISALLGGDVLPTGKAYLIEVNGLHNIDRLYLKEVTETGTVNPTATIGLYYYAAGVI